MSNEEYKTLRRLGFRNFLLRTINFASVFASGLMVWVWKGLGLITNTELPIVVVLRCVYQPFHRGDLLFLINPPSARHQIGDVTVYKIPGQDIPIVHRVLETHDLTVARLFSVREAEPRPQNQSLLTMGNNNYLDDHMVGKVRGIAM
ncbi:hypothetical protein BC827DRAFT_1257719 [Russula dissimulans]|nr:hypothetical protein BC827DRAFT_1257719 [Russula dissimulans]